MNVHVQPSEPALLEARSESEAARIEEARSTAREAPLSVSWAPAARVAVLLLSDAAALVAAGAVAYFSWARLVRGQPPQVYLELLLLVPLFLLAFASAGLYPGFGLGAIEIVRRLSVRTTVMFVALAAMSFAFRVPHHYSRLAFVMAWVLALVLLPVNRFLVETWVRRFRWWSDPVLIIGISPLVGTTIESLKYATTSSFRLIGVLTGQRAWQGKQIEGIPVLGGPDLIPEFAQKGVKTAFVLDVADGGETTIVDQVQQYFRRVVLVRSYGEVPVEGAEVRNLGGFLGVEFRNQLLRRRNRVLKRGLDLVLGGGAFLLSLPVVTVCALAVKLSSRGSPFYYQLREGYLGSSLKVWKLRTMYADAERRLKKILDSDPRARREWEERFKLEKDPRVLPVIGSFLRRFSLDELPQLWQVVRGEMSLVGPRPFPDYHLRKFSPRIRELRQRVRPGLTGLWQVMVRSEGNVDMQQAYDSYYVRNWSLWMDLYVLMRTTVAVVRGRGAY